MKKDVLLLCLILLPAVSWLVQPGYFTMHDDLQAMRQLQMDKCLKDGQIPCRWSQDLGFGFGYPLFNFYPPLPYLPGLIFIRLGLSYLDTVKAVGILGFGLTAFFMYLLGKQFWGRLGGVVSSAFYTYAPYHALDFFVRGAMNEFWAMAFYPAIFFTSYKLIETSSKKWIPLLSLSVAALMLSHNLMFMIFTPFFLLWIIFWWIRFKSFKSLFPLAVSSFWAAGLAAFFTLPVIFEQKFAHVETLVIGYFNYLSHFLDINQIFFRNYWGYGESIYGPGDTMSFSLGYLHWLVPLTVLLLLLFVKKIRKLWYLILLLLLFTLTSLFMSHSKTTPIWIAVSPLKFLQFPWRFLTLSVFFVSLISGAAGLLLSRKIIPYLLLLLLLLNANFFRPRLWHPDATDTQKFSGDSWRMQVTSGIFDYLPVWAPLPPPDPAGDDVNIITGRGIYSRLMKKTNRQRYQIFITTPTAVAELQTFYFPGWRIWVDGREVAIDPSRDKFLGKMQVDLTSGRHDLIARFTNTPVRTVGNALSLVSWIALLFVLLSNKYAPSLRDRSRLAQGV
ncbi:hypothetical protein A3H89_01095 [Candidatus Amesbacteria bacterium RIFCSPLOWO2_02_FULL_48_11]|uniref:Membrane protein 6-pyruvoyl-tetrahydropterin synthase-related domain-containing protein n=2 Tax=Candidatus Amesiibacteriota TaxID=1752730 RepID=A0A1F4Z5S8_9BACT|nr:MAG: hypothetical protein UX78_C0020G0020 [Candidatus Amesbacteria bacterium GW2011_GWA2_47_11]OGC91132.1 MAG: hypothetical protein A2V48_04920 [Candidatus Amesbacteria bacterium RBG_19FT_COMBO_48_16]OGC95609.1 MAG: hypothetical protein A3C34_00075 [Candidatus Amesbacteria bacterium RIFCSPHIGHO2_02_FULL_48_21]OGC98555.1 MAG: hypothetical protein A2W16_01435 [Candidatus Amesbacteria bacterium RBG_16_48_31]OGC99501.1 MAG: hypothetical protein A2702_03225 [Candidatus Amesbacteria bacterium RIFC